MLAKTRSFILNRFEKIKKQCIQKKESVQNSKKKLIKDKSKSFYFMQYQGGHLAGTIVKLEQEGLFKIQSITEFGSGCKEYLVKDVLTGQIFTHSEFPPHWTIERIAQETKQAVEHAMKTGAKMNLPVKGTTSDGFKLKIITNAAPEVHECVSIKNTVNQHIVTSHPIYERKL